MASPVPTNFATLTGAEILRLYGVAANGQPSGQDFLATTAQIAALAETETNITNTLITTVGAGTLTAAGLVGGLIMRSGPTANFTDTTDTAAKILAALPGIVVGSSFLIRIKNNTAFIETLAAGAGVTLPLTTLIPPFSIGYYYGTLTTATTVTLTHLSTSQFAGAITLTVPALTALTTVGAGTILAAGFASGLTARGGSTAAFTDTTDTAANIIAATPNLVNRIGAAMVYRYVNNTVAPATITGGTGVTVSGVTVVPPNSWADYLITYTAAATLNMVGTAQGYFPSTGTYVNNGTTPVTVANAAVTANSNIIFTLKTVGGTVSASPPNVKTITPGTGFTVAGLASDTSTYNYEIRG